MTEMLTLIIVVVTSIIALAIVGGIAFMILRKQAKTETTSHSIAERVRAVGKLAGLEVVSKEIVTQTKGLKWLPPLLLSQARIAMIFHFEKQYFVDLGRIREQDVCVIGPRRYEITLPPIEGHLSLLDVTPYDIQAGKLLGLLDVFRMDADVQKELMDKAQVEAAKLYEDHAARYETEARRAISRQVAGLLELFDVGVEVRFFEDTPEAQGRNNVATTYNSAGIGDSQKSSSNGDQSAA